MRSDDPELTLVVSASAGDIHSPANASTGTSTTSVITTIILAIIDLIPR